MGLKIPKMKQHEGVHVLVKSLAGDDILGPEHFSIPLLVRDLKHKLVGSAPLVCDLIQEQRRLADDDLIQSRENGALVVLTSILQQSDSSIDAMDTSVGASALWVRVAADRLLCWPQMDLSERGTGKLLQAGSEFWVAKTERGDTDGVSKTFWFLHDESCNHVGWIRVNSIEDPAELRPEIRAERKQVPEVFARRESRLACIQGP